MPGLLDANVQQALQQHMLNYLTLRDLAHLAQVCKDLHLMVREASPEVWQQAATLQMPWHPPIAPGLAPARAAVQKYAASCRNLSAGESEVVAEWDDVVDEFHTDRVLVCLSPGGSSIARADDRSVCVIQLSSGESRRLDAVPEQRVLSMCWHPDEGHISVLSQALAGTRLSDRRTFAVLQTSTGTHVFHFEAACSAQLQYCWWSPGAMLMAVHTQAVGFCIYNLARRTEQPIVCRTSADGNAKCIRCEWSPGSTKVAAMCTTVQIFDAISGTLLVQLDAWYHALDPLGTHIDLSMLWDVESSGWLNDSAYLTACGLSSQDDKPGDYHKFNLCKVAIGCNDVQIDPLCADVQIPVPKCPCSPAYHTDIPWCQHLIVSRNQKTALLQVASCLSCDATQPVLVDLRSGSVDESSICRSFEVVRFSPCSRFVAFRVRQNANPYHPLLIYDTLSRTFSPCMCYPSFFGKLVWGHDSSSLTAAELTWGEEGLSNNACIISFTTMVHKQAEPPL